MKRSSVILVAWVVLAAACTGGGDEGPKGASGGDPVARGGTLRVAISLGSVANGDPNDYSGYAGRIWELDRCCLLRTLFSYNGKPFDQGGTVARPDLAAGEPEVSDDGLVWTIRMKPGLFFAPPLQDREIVAADVIRALERAVDPEASPAGYAFYYSVIEGADAFAAGKAGSISGLAAPDDHTLVIRLTEPAGDLNYRLSMPGTAPIPQEIAEGHQRDFLRFLVATGPYMIQGSEGLDFSASPEEQVPVSGFAPQEQRLSLVRNPSWDAASDRLRAAYADRIEVLIGFDRRPGAKLNKRELVEAVDEGTLDVNLIRPSDEQVRRYQSDPQLRGRLHTYLGNSMYYFGMNLALPPFDDVHVRRAVSLAVDEPELAASFGPNAVAVGLGGESFHIAPEAAVGGLLSSYAPTWSPGTGAQLEAAAAEMRLSAYDADGNGLCDDPVCGSVPVVAPPYAKKGALLMVDSLAELGIELELELVRPIVYWRYEFDPLIGIDVGDIAWATDFPSGSSVFPPLFGRESLPPACCNSTLLGATPSQLAELGYEDTSVPGVEDQIRRCTSLTGQVQTECWAALDQYLMEDVVPVLPIAFWREWYPVSERVVGFSFDQAFAYPALDRIALAPGSD